MKDRHDEGVAIHIGPEPCVVPREGGSEASVGERVGQPLSPVKIHIPGADAVAKVEGDTDGRATASALMTRRGRRTWHAWKLVARRGPTPETEANFPIIERSLPNWVTRPQSLQLRKCDMPLRGLAYGASSGENVSSELAGHLQLMQ